MKAFLLVLGLTVAFTAYASEEERVVALLGSKENAEIVRQADRVESCPLIIDWALAAKYGMDKGTSEGAYIVLSEADSSLLKEKLLAPSSYTWGDEEKDCTPDYHVRVRFHQRSRLVEVDFCFGCDILQFHRRTEILARKDFDPASKELFSVFLRLFPDDPTMRLLRQRREVWESKKKKEANHSPQPTQSAVR